MLRHARRADVEPMVDLYVDAFATDPFFRFVQPDDGAWPDFGRAWFRFVVELLLERGHTYVADPLDVATGWVPPDLALVGADDVARGAAILAEHGGPERGEAALQTILAARAHSLDAPHWTLQYVGVRSTRQGAGLGGSAVAAMLSVCDAEQLPCELVSTNPRNVPFYERLGFRVTAEVRSPDGTIRMRPMTRPASSGA
jgi:GNAT superfamily N-acetyltransferase